MAMGLAGGGHGDTGCVVMPETRVVEGPMNYPPLRVSRAPISMEIATR
jgi:hypothetical protein